jgi:hypothetical protein
MSLTHVDPHVRSGNSLLSVSGIGRVELIHEISTGPGALSEFD